MTRRAVFAFAAILLASGGRAKADDDEPQAYDFWLDPLLRPSLRNPKSNVYVDGDTLTIHLDPKRLFPDETKDGDLGFIPESAPPEVRGIYLVGPGAGTTTPLSIQPGSCAAALSAAQADLDVKQSALAKLPSDADAAARKTAEDAVTAARAALKAAQFVAPALPAFACSEEPDWAVERHYRGYVCGGDKALGDLIKASSSWTLVQKTSRGLACVRDYTLKPGSAVSEVSATFTNGSNPAQVVTISKDSGIYSGNVPIKATTRSIVISVKYETGVINTYPLEIKASARDAHSPVRVQAEVLSTNRLRVISFAVAVSPVSREYFTKGPSGCFFGCLATAVALLRMGGDDHTVVQFGLGAGLGLARGFQLNAGVMFGAPDLNSAWRLDRSWFFGIAIDPVILADVVSQGNSTKK
jgi:hypothetical protein